MALSAGSAKKGRTTSRLLNRLSHDLANETTDTDVGTAATGDLLLGIDISDDYGVKYFDAADIAVIMGTTQADQTKLNDITASAAEINMAADSSANYESVTGANVLTAAESGKTIILNSATAFETTLPAKAAGLRFDFWCGAAEVTGGNHTIIVNAADDDTLFGSINAAGAVVVCDTKATITLVADKFTAGDRVSVFNDGTNWYVDGNIAIAAGVTFDT